MIASASRRGRGKAQKSLDLIDAAYRILFEIQPASVRAVCYKLFTAGLIESMEKRCTNRVGNQLTWARENDRIPWEWIVDGTRTIERPSRWDNPAALLRDAAHQYRVDRWNQQQAHLLICSEKSTVEGTVKPITDRYGLGFLSVHGYSSATSAHDVAELSLNVDRPTTVLYIGDWDPSGLDMSERDLPKRLKRYGGLVEIRRIALTDDDIADPNLQDHPAESKRKDPRYPWFARSYGSRCWELDALNPNTLRDRVDETIRDYIDWDSWDRCEKVEVAERTSLLEVVAAWKGV